MRKNVKLILGSFVATSAIALTTASSCDKVTEPFQDAPISHHQSDPAEVLDMPDGFSNMAAKCDGPNMVYSAFHGDANRTSIAVVPNDPRCTGKP